VSEERAKVLDSLVLGFLDGFARVLREKNVPQHVFWKNDLFKNREIKTVNRKIS
jgi:hypothetical protein